MESFSTYAYTNEKMPPAFSFPFASDSSLYSDSLPMASRGKKKTNEVVSHHQRCLSKSLLMEEEPFWLEDLLSEPVAVSRKGHRRSASDSYSYLGTAAEHLYLNEEPNFKDLNQVSIDTTPNSPDEMIHKASHESNEGASMSSEKHNKDESGTQNQESSSEKANNPQQKPPMSKAEAKRAKQQSAHRSRVRKLQHIAELEMRVQTLQAEECEMSAELEFIDQRNLIMRMETRALRQRLDSLSQEFLIKHMEQEMLERELVRLQTLCQLQQQQQQQQHSKNRRTKSHDRDHLELQFANLSTKNSEVSSGKAGSVSRSVWIQ